MAESHTRDRGFTLVEVVIVVTLIGVIALAIGGVFSVVVRTLPATEARADDARSLLGLSTWLPPDVASTPITPVPERNNAFDTRPDSSSGCDPVAGDGSENLLRLTWTEDIGSPLTYTASYRMAERNGGWHIVRVTCVNGGAAQVINLTAALAPPSADPDLHPVFVELREDADTDMVIGVAFTVSTIDGESIRVDAISQNPAEELPPLESSDGAVAPPSGGEEEEEEEPPPPLPPPGPVCALLMDPKEVQQPPTLVGSPLKRDGSDGDEGRLTGDTGVTAQLVYAVSVPIAELGGPDATCDTLRLQYDILDSSTPGPYQIDMVVERYECRTIDPEDDERCEELIVDARADLPKVAAERWTDRTDHPAVLLAGDSTALVGSAATFEVVVDPDTVPPPCLARITSVNPGSVRNTGIGNNGNAELGPLRDPVDVTVEVISGSCGNLGLIYEHNPESGIGWKAIPPDGVVKLRRVTTELWRDGHRALILRDGQDGDDINHPNATATLTIL